MVSLGTIFTIAVAGAIATGVYVVSRNTDKIGSAFSRGTQNILSNPFGNYLDSLFQNGSTSSSAPRTPTPTAQTIPLSQPGAGLPNPANAPTHPTPIDVGLSQGIKPEPSQTVADPNLSADKFQPPKPSAGWYYINYQGSKYDTQWNLTAKKAAELMKTASAPDDALVGIKFLGSSKLQPSGFRLFGKANQYL